MSNDLLYRIALTMIPGVGGVTVKKIMMTFGSAEAFFSAPLSRLYKILSPNIMKHLNRTDVLNLAEEELKFIEANGIKPVFYVDSDYPRRLNMCYDAPAMLFVKGITDLNSVQIVSIVGTRTASQYGISLCKKFISDFVSRTIKPVIVSGLAYGIDVCAHTAALANGLETIAVMGTALNRVYPAAHEKIARQIEKQGALVTEFATKSSISQGNFISRNRIIAGMSDVTIVVESSTKGGALFTAAMAASYDREVMAFPGRVGDEHSEGCNKLIKWNNARLIESVDDLEVIMQWPFKPNTVQAQLKFLSLSEQEQAIYNILKDRDSESFDNIVTETGISAAELAGLLMNMEFSEIVNVLPGSRYSLRYL
jgi:DNA processing protein